MTQNDESKNYDYYEQQFDPLNTDRKARRKRKPQVRHIPKNAGNENVSSIVDDTAGLEGGFQTTYSPSRYESSWLLSSLARFYDQELITDVQAVVKGGKEASVYRCEAHPRLGIEWLAAKVYRPRMFRSLSNDQMYREGRSVLTSEGNAVKKTDHRTMRAINKKTAFGEKVAHTSWLMYEYTTLETLHQAGAAVPQPLAANENAILMSYLGDGQMAAPALSEIRLEPDEALPLFGEVMRNIELLLQHEMIHGDLSAYNILYWAGQVTLIDFPQVTNSSTNRNALFILQRDIERVCEYFERQGVKRNPAAILERLLERYMKPSTAEIEDLEAFDSGEFDNRDDEDDDDD